MKQFVNGEALPLKEVAPRLSGPARPGVPAAVLVTRREFLRKFSLTYDEQMAPIERQAMHAIDDEFGELHRRGFPNLKSVLADDLLRPIALKWIRVYYAYELVVDLLEEERKEAAVWSLGDVELITDLGDHICVSMSAIKIRRRE